jgi:CyaY protein
MNPKELEDSAFDKLADGQLKRLDKALSSFDPDEVESYLGGDVLNLTIGNGTKIVINRHRAARQIWMAALRRAWHFSYETDTATWCAPGENASVPKVELVAKLEEILSQQLKRPIKLFG